MVQFEAKPSEIDPTPEPIWYFRSLRLYKGKYPAYYDVSELPGTAILEEHYEAIRDEILTFYNKQSGSIKSNNIPYNYEDPGWKTHTLFAFGLKHRKNCDDLPFLESIVSQIPDMTTATVSILEPQTRIHAHVGSSSAIIRTHLGISIPAAYPDVGIKVRGNARGWEEGKLFGIEMAHRHYAWNNTDQFRIALTVDTMKPEHVSRRNSVCGRCLALLGLQTIAERIPSTKRLPRPVIGTIHTVASLGVRVLVAAQRCYLAVVERKRPRRKPPAPAPQATKQAEEVLAS